MSRDCPTVYIELPADQICIECDLTEPHAVHMAMFGEDVVATWTDDAFCVTPIITITTPVGEI